MAADKKHDEDVRPPVGMPQLDPFAYMSNFFWLCVSFSSLYIFFGNDGLPKIARMLKLRKRGVYSLENNTKIPEIRNVQAAGERLLGRGFSTGASYMQSSLSKVAETCDSSTVTKRAGITPVSVSRFGEISASRSLEKNLFPYFPKYFNSSLVRRVPKQPSLFVAGLVSLPLMHRLGGGR